MPSVYILEDDPLIIDFLSVFFTEFSDYDLIGHSKDLDHALAVIKEAQPDVIIADLQLQPTHEQTNLSALKEVAPVAKLCVYSGSCAPSVVTEHLQAGIHCYIFKSDGMTELSNALNTLQSGERYFSKSIREMLKRVGFELTAC